MITALPDAPILVAEQDSSSAITDIPELFACNKLLLEDSQEFNKSRLVNLAAANSQGEILLVCDADVIVEAHQLDLAWQAVQADYDFARPYGQLIDLDPEQTNTYLNSQILVDDYKEGESNDRSHLGERLCWAGGVFLVKKSVFFDLGGFDERFQGWGGEDNAFELQLRKHNKKVGINQQGKAWHLWHPRADGSSTRFGGKNHRLIVELYKQAALAKYR